MFRQCLRVLQNLGHPDPTLLVGVTFLFHTMEVPLAALLMLMGFILFSMASDMNMQHLKIFDDLGIYWSGLPDSVSLRWRALTSGCGYWPCYSLVVV
ncbi:hypothetical protein QQP08_009711 [Theobroma cacao]|nr:hypothetical protein QQP08_009711 [Theobroma cacao]